MNPVPGADGLTLNISETDNAQDLVLLRDVAEHFRLKPKVADAVIAEVVNAVRSWRKVAKGLGLSRSEIDRMASAFRIADAHTASSSGPHSR